jgi:hypothetical protein
MSEWSGWFGLTCPQNDVPCDSSCVHFCPCQSVICLVSPSARHCRLSDIACGRRRSRTRAASGRFLRGDPANVWCPPFMFCAALRHSHVITQNYILSIFIASWRRPRSWPSDAENFFSRNQFGQNKHRFYCRSTVAILSPDSAVGIATDYGLDDRGVRV